MSTINELYLEIEDLDKKIEEEPRRRLKRKLMIEDEIKRLEEEKRRSGLHGDFQSVQQFNTQIKRLQHESTGGNVYEYESEVKVLKHKLLNLLLDYYKEGGMVKYTIGSFESMREAYKFCNELNKTFPGCFVVKFKDGQRVK